jgi:hypothetical protein
MLAEPSSEHSRESLEYIQTWPPLKLAQRTMFKRLRHFEIQLSYAIDQISAVPLFPEPNKRCLHAQHERNFIGATAINTSGWIDLANSLTLSVETVKITDAIDPLLYYQAGEPHEDARKKGGSKGFSASEAAQFMRRGRDF